MAEIKKRKEDVYVWKCTKCNRILRSLYPNQIKSLVRQHKTTHEDEEKKR